MLDATFNRLQILINKAYYASKRYNTPSSFAYMYHEKPLSPEELGSLVRISDHFLQMDENHYFIHYQHTEQNAAFKASQNLLLKLDKHFNNTTSCIALDTYDTSKSPRVAFNRLDQILRETKKSSYNRIEDENVLNDYV